MMKDDIEVRGASLSVQDVAAILQEIQAQVEQERAKRIKLEAEVERQRTKGAAQQENNAPAEGLPKTVVSSRRRIRRSSRSSSIPSIKTNHKELTALQTEVAGYRQLVESLTQERPAIASAMMRERTKKATKILPLQLVRLLELIPWHQYIETRVNVKDAVYEWQRFDPFLQAWRGDLPSFPEFFHALPVVRTSPHGDDYEDSITEEEEEDGYIRLDHSSHHQSGSSTTDSAVDNSESGSSSSDNSSPRRNSLTIGQKSKALTIALPSGRRNGPGGSNGLDFPSFLAGLLPSSNKISQRHGDVPVLTNANLTKRYILNATEGFPLPNPAVSGTWRWIGRWMIDQPVPSAAMPVRKRTLPTIPPTARVEPPPKQKQPLKSILNFFDPGNSSDDNDSYKPAIPQDKDACLCDREGWTYAKEASHFVLWNSKELCWGGDDESAVGASSCTCRQDENWEEEREPTDTERVLEDSCLHCRHRRKPVLRRRKWTRQRVLVDYPDASNSSLEFLRLAAHNASMKLAAQELSTKLKEVSSENSHVQNHWEAVQQTNQIQLQHFQGQWERHEEKIKHLRYGKFKRKIEELTCNQDDILPIIANPNMFGQLQQALRKSGAITNAMLQQGIHFYILDHVRPNHKKKTHHRRRSSCGGGRRSNATSRRPSVSSTVSAATANTTATRVVAH